MTKADDTWTDTQLHVVIDEFRKLTPPHRTLRGYARVVFPNGLIFESVSIHVGLDHPWCNPLARPMIDSETGVALRDEDGRIKYQSLLNFTTRRRREAWSQQILKALRAKHPEVFD